MLTELGLPLLTQGMSCRLKDVMYLDVLLKTNEYQSIMSIFMLVYLEMAEDD